MSETTLRRRRRLADNHTSTRQNLLINNYNIHSISKFTKDEGDTDRDNKKIKRNENNGAIADSNLYYHNNIILLVGFILSIELNAIANDNEREQIEKKVRVGHNS